MCTSECFLNHFLCRILRQMLLELIALFGIIPLMVIYVDDIMLLLCVVLVDNYGNWSNYGCSVLYQDSDTVICGCNHLTTFALLLVRLLSIILSLLLITSRTCHQMKRIIHHHFLIRNL